MSCHHKRGAAWLSLAWREYSVWYYDLQRHLLHRLLNRVLYLKERSFSIPFSLNNDRLLMCCPVGKDATKIFDDYGHSADAKKIRSKYLIGALVRSHASRLTYTVLTSACTLQYSTGQMHSYPFHFRSFPFRFVAFAECIGYLSCVT